MGIEKQAGNYSGGFFQLFDWKSKSRKKLFSSKSDVSEQSKQKKRSDGNLPSTRLHMLLDGDEIIAGSDYSCASSVNDDDFYATKAPNVVARLMGLESLPKSNEPYSSPYFDSQSLSDAYYRTKNLAYCQDSQSMHSTSFSVQSDTKPTYLKPMPKAIEKFQAENLPPKSAKSIPITHHKLLSPIKSRHFIPAKDAAHIMEAAVRIIEQGPQVGTKKKLPPVSASSVPLKVKDLKDKVQNAQKRSKVYEVSRESGAGVAKQLKGHSANKSCNGSTETVSKDSDVKNKGKSISLALQAKANVQKRGGLNSGRTSGMEKETSEFNTGQMYKTQSNTQNNIVKKPSTQNVSSVLRQNNQKQNCLVDRGKVFPKQNEKTLTGDTSCARQRISSKASVTSKVNSRKLGSESKDDRKEITSRKKRSIDGTSHSEKNRAECTNEKGTGSSSSTVNRKSSSWEQESVHKGNDVVSFTFTAPLTRSGLGSNYNVLSSDSGSKRALLSANGACASKFTFMDHGVEGGDALSTLLEQKLKELTDLVDSSHQKRETAVFMSSTMTEDHEAEDGRRTNQMEWQEERVGMHGRNISQARKLLDSRIPSPVSVLEHSSFAESCNSTNSIDSHSSRQYCSSSFLSNECYPEQSYSASPISAESVSKKRWLSTVTPLPLIQHGKRGWELEYINGILFNVELMYKNYALGRATEVIDPRLFDQIETQKCYFSNCKEVSRKVMFDSVSECMDLRCRSYVNGGYKLWAKGVSVVKRKERLAEEICKEIECWSGLGDSMVDEIVDRDMSSQYGKWLDFEIEAFELGVQIESRILNSLIDEVIDDIILLL